MYKYKKISLIIIIFVILLSVAGNVFAQGFEVDHVASDWEKVKEKIALLAKFSKSSKVEYRKYLSNKRLAELVYVVNSGDVNRIEETSARYSAYMGRLNEYVIDNKMTDYKSSLSEMYTEHKNIIDGLQTDFEYDSGFWLALQWSEDTTDNLSVKLDEI